MAIPTYLPYFLVAGTAATLVAILYGLNQALAGAAWPAQDRARALLVSATILVGWLAAAIALSAMDVYHVNASAIPTIQYGILLPILVGVLLIWRSEATKRIIGAVPQAWIVSVQLYRALGVIFLILYCRPGWAISPSAFSRPS
jgi:cytochrome bd-type quinol oxidase subunit 2